MKCLINIIEIKWYVYVIAIAIIILLIYIGLVISSFCLMNSFKQKMDKCVESIRIDFFQMQESLNKILDLFKVYIDEKTYLDLKEKINKYEFKNLSKDEFFICFSSFEVIKKTLEGIYINNFESTNNETINLLFSSFKDVTIHYTDMTQDFNSNAVGFNYWRNLYFTKWIKKLFKIEEVTSIK